MTLVKFKNSDHRPVGYRPFFAPLFEDFFSDSLVNDSFTNKLPAVNVGEKADAFTIELAAPGLEKEDFKLHLEGELLTISVEKQDQKSESTDRYTRKEFSYAAFTRSFVLPEMANKEEIAANYTNGVLSINIAKQPEAKVMPKEIKIS